MESMDSYTKLFSSIVRSTVWRESKETKVVWITMLALKDARHIVESSIPGLAGIAGVSTQECEEALERLKSPDPYSRTKDFGGRRIEEVEGGWRILNGEKYQQKGTEEHRRAYRREWMRGRREMLARVKREGEADGRTQVVNEALGLSPKTEEPGQ